MANTADAENSEETAVVWDGPRYEAALAHFDKLQEQIDNLRATLPSIIAPLAQPGLTRAKRFEKAKSTALRSASDLKAFREAWTSDHTQGLLAKSRESFQSDSDLSKASDVARYGWAQEQH